MACRLDGGTYRPRRDLGHRGESRVVHSFDDLVPHPNRLRPLGPRLGRSSAAGRGRLALSVLYGAVPTGRQDLLTFIGAAAFHREAQHIRTEAN